MACTAFLAALLMLSACLGTEEDLDLTVVEKNSAALEAFSNEAAQTCTIRLGSGGQTYEYTARLSANESQVFASVAASEFVRSTSGPCHFRIYNGANLAGSHVVLGTNLTGRIRAGLDAITRKDTGGGRTWKVRSIELVRRPEVCRLRAGGNGVRMEYFEDYVTPTPAMDRIDYLAGGECAAQVYATADFGADDAHNRFKRLQPTSTSRSPYDPGFATGSLAIWRVEATCPEFTKDQGRCLPQTTLERSLYTSNTTRDRDRDGLDDELENALAEAFAPVYLNHSTENATREAAYIDVEGEPVPEPVTIFQVSSDGPGTLRIQYMRLWLQDIWGTPTCPGHKGDSQRHTIWLATSPTDAPDHGQFWYVSRTNGGIQSDLAWRAGDDALRAPHFVRLSGESGPPRHLAIYFSKGKHHEYADSGWSGKPDKECIADTAYVNGRGHLHVPPYPMRAANLRAPRGRGDAFQRNNVGSRAYPFFDDLAPYGFPGECVWNCGKFYSANEPSRGFD